ncbi:MAG: metalloregulator ArsR/SmtB family transcription factor [Candidatus Bathyarchaeota archaeon]|nr:MAG: metalloregulator ArsR/SmtB family transcription factor [Candidatus Bathyarchaeota archaeon]
MKPFKEVDPKAWKLLGDETRRNIIFLLRVKELTVSEIATEIDMTPQAIYHHIKKLEKAGLVEVTREERSGHLIESYYRATAETFICSIGSLYKKKVKIDMLTVLEGLSKLGFKVESSDEIASKLVDLETKSLIYKGSNELEDAIVKLEKEMDFMTLEMVKYYADLMSMSEEEFQKRQKLVKALRHFLLSICKERPEFQTRAQAHRS